VTWSQDLGREPLLKRVEQRSHYQAGEWARLFEEVGDSVD